MAGERVQLPRDPTRTNVLLAKARELLAKTWWGTLPALVILFALSYLVVWQVAEPVGLVKPRSALVNFLGSPAGSVVVLALLLALVLALCLHLLLRRADETALIDIHTPQTTPTTLVGSYPYSQHPEFFKTVEELLKSSHRVTLIAIGLNALWQKHLFETLIRRAQSGEALITICIANPFSPLVQERWVEEMQGIQPQFGIEGSRRSLSDLVERFEGEGMPEGMRFLVFDNYPAFATLIFDRDVFVYPYGYQLIGNFSPIFHLRAEEDFKETQFFLDNANRVIADAVDARTVARIAREPTSPLDDRWTALAVYFIPSADEDLYSFGSEILGYDVVNERVLGGGGGFDRLRPQVGSAGQYGFHLTIADSLYFAGGNAVKRMHATLRALGLEFSEFEVDVLPPTNDFRSGDEVVMRAIDPSGTLEALHCELLSRMYKFATSSNYRSGRSKRAIRDRGGGHRAELMIRHYGSPYILSSFEPHFTLLSNLPADDAERRRTLEELESSYRERVRDTRLTVDTLCLMGRTSPRPFWQILERIPLRSRV